MRRLIKFFYGRYGIDELYKFMLYFYLVLFLLNIFIKSSILYYIELVLLVVLVYRTLSKNIYQRQKENKFYLNIKKKFTKKNELIKRMWNDKYTHTYRKCPKCHNTLRLPLKKGKHMVKCPNCSNRFKVMCLRNEKVKVEIIK